MTIEDRKTFIKHSRRLIKALTEELYEDAYQVLREYICNAVDGKATEVQIIYRPPYKNMNITDNGDGIDKSTWEFMLENFAMSQKRKDPETIGMHGLGVYSGARICEDIIVKTKTSSDEEVRVVKFPVHKWLDFEEDEETGEIEEDSLQEGIYYFRSTEPVSKSSTESFTTIILTDLKQDTQNKLSDKNEFNKFLEMAQKSWPLDFSPEFKRKNAEIYEQISTFYQEKKLLGSFNQFVIKVYINEKQIYKWNPIGKKKSQLSLYPIRKIPVEVDGKIAAWIWWTLYKQKTFLKNYPYVEKWLDYLSRKSREELTEGEFDDLEIPEQFKLKSTRVNELYVKELIRKAESTKTLMGTFLRQKNVMIYAPATVWSDILNEQRARQWRQCWGEIFVIDNDIYPEMSRKNLRGKNIKEFMVALKNVLVGDQVLGEIAKYHHKGTKKTYISKVKALDQHLKTIFEPEEEEAEEEQEEDEGEEDDEGEQEKDEDEGEQEKEDDEGEQEKDEDEGEQEKDEEEGEQEKDEDEGEQEEDGEEGEQEEDEDEGEQEKDEDEGEQEEDEDDDFTILIERLKPNEFDPEILSQLKNAIINAIKRMNSLNEEEMLELLISLKESE